MASNDLTIGSAWDVFSDLRLGRDLADKDEQRFQIICIKLQFGIMRIPSQMEVALQHTKKLKMDGLDWILMSYETYQLSHNQNAII